MKKCTICHEIKDKSEYWKRKNRHGNPAIYSYCKVCSTEKKRQWRLNNPEKYKAQNKRKEKNRKPRDLTLKYARHQTERDNLDDIYIKFLLTINNSLKYEDLTEDMIKAQRASLQLKRALGLTNYKKETNEK